MNVHRTVKRLKILQRRSDLNPRMKYWGTQCSVHCTKQYQISGKDMHQGFNQLVVIKPFDSD